MNTNKIDPRQNSRLYNWLASTTPVSDLNIEIETIVSDLTESDRIEHIQEYLNLCDTAQSSNDINLKVFVLLLYVIWHENYSKYAMEPCTDSTQYLLIHEMREMLTYFAHGLRLTGGLKFVRETYSEDIVDRSVTGFVSKIRTLCVSII